MPYSSPISHWATLPRVVQRRAGCFPCRFEGMSFSSSWKNVFAFAFGCRPSLGLGSSFWRHIGQTFFVTSVCIA